MNATPIFIVKNSPWRDRLPDGTKVIECDPRKGFEHSTWYKRVDNKPIFDEKEEADGKFVLRSSEIEKLKTFLFLVTKPSTNKSEEKVMTEEEYFEKADEASFKYDIIKEIK